MRDLIQEAFDSQVLSAQRVDPGYPNTNDVWLVQTESGWQVLKVSGHPPHEDHGGFWLGLRTLFGCQPYNELVHQSSLSDYLNGLGEIPVPRVLKCVQSDQPFGHPYLICERMPGLPVSYGSPQEHALVSSPDMMRQLGRHIGTLHVSRDLHLGNFPETKTFVPDEYPERLARTMQTLASHTWAEDVEVRESLPDFMSAARQVSPPEHISLIMPDMGPGQFLTDNGHITALIDIESYVRGPVELELAVLELWTADAEAFRAGYVEVNDSFPDIGDVRMVYRFFIYLLYNAPPKGLANWLGAPIVFD